VPSVVQPDKGSGNGVSWQSGITEGLSIISKHALWQSTFFSFPKIFAVLRTKNLSIDTGTSPQAFFYIPLGWKSFPVSRVRHFPLLGQKYILPPRSSENEQRFQGAMAREEPASSPSTNIRKTAEYNWCEERKKPIILKCWKSLVLRLSISEPNSGNFFPLQGLFGPVPSGQHC
jgi:hypothetical protein